MIDYKQSILKTALSLAVLLHVLLLSACLSTGSVPRLFTGQSLSYDLTRGYKMLAEYEKYLQEDVSVAAYFEDKAKASSWGKPVTPGTVEDKDLSVADKEQLIAARQQLVQGIENKDRVKNISALAEAQLNFECWLMRAARGMDTASFCREIFYETIESIDIQDQNARLFSVHFDSGKAIPSAAGMAVIQQAAYAYAVNEDWPVYLIGYTDSVGDPGSNRVLSMRRAMAVRNALAQFGVDMDMVEIEAVGEADTSGSDAQARRVDIRIEPAYAHKVQSNIDPEEVLPAHF